MIFDYFDAAYFINLDKRTDRRDKFEQQCREINLPVERFSAICPDPEQYKGRIHNTPNAHFLLGCTMSHQAVIRLAKERNQNCVLIFEDDAIFCSNFMDKLQIISSELKTITNWDLCYLGCSPEPDFHKANPSGMSCEKVTENIYFNPGAARGTASIIIHSQFYDKILDLDPCWTYPADLMFIHYPPIKRRYLMAKELLVIQDDTSVSDLWGTPIAREQIYKDHYAKYII